MSELETDDLGRLLDHLARLERELVTVRRELHQQRKTTSLPQGAFEALRVSIGGEHYALPSLPIRQIIRFARLIRIPHAERAVLGALNLRGEVVVVLDAALRLDLGQSAVDQKTPVVIAVVHGRLIGLVVERVLDVVTLDRSQLQEPSSAIGSARCVAAVGPVFGQLVQVLDLDQLTSARELDALEDAFNQRDDDGRGPSSTREDAQ